MCVMLQKAMDKSLCLDDFGGGGGGGDLESQSLNAKTNASYTVAKRDLYSW
jgi:hypothetical protein